MVRGTDPLRIYLRQRRSGPIPRLPRLDALLRGRHRRPEGQMTQLLVSVRSAAEAGAALEGGSGMIDVKEPASGPLGTAPVAVTADVLCPVSGRVPVSQAAGTGAAARPCPS